MSGLILSLALVGAPADQPAAPDSGSPEAVELAIKLITQADEAAKEGRVARPIRLAERVAVLAPAAPGA